MYPTIKILLRKKSINQIIQIVKLSTSNCLFKYNNIYKQQKFRLPMGSPINGILACLFLESKAFKYILPNDIHYSRYIDDILIIYPNKYKYKYFFDILLINNSNKLEFKFYHKENYKND